jgi:DMSO/TMAO reductase YedYZ molybdopterin-dependent catalytic subunit
VKSLANISVDPQNPTGWFEPLYAEAKGDPAQVPWAKNQPHPYLQEWLSINSPPAAGKLVLVINWLRLGGRCRTTCQYRLSGNSI